MDKISKLLEKLSTQEQRHVEKVLTALLAGKLSSLDIKKLKGVENIYRARVGTLRIIFQRYGADIQVLEISRRDEQAYGKY